MMYQTQPSGTDQYFDEEADVYFYSDTFAGGWSVQAGTTTVYMHAYSLSTLDSGITWRLYAGSGASWAELGSGVMNCPFPTNGLMSVSFSTSSYTFDSGEQLRLVGSVGYALEIDWDGAYNDSRLLIPGITSPTPTPTPTAGGDLLAYWAFDDGSGQTAADSSGNGNDGTLGTTAGVDSGDPTWASCSGGGSALVFDGTDDEVRLSNAIIGDRATWTITAWIKMGADTADDRTIYGEGHTVDEIILWLRVKQATQYVGFWYENPEYNWTGNIEGTTDVEDDQWHLVTMVQRSKIDRELYVGTTSQGTNTDDPGTLTNNIGSIGYLRTDSYVADPFLGLIDDVRIYDYALSPAEISALAASPPSGCAP